ncbi:hypothetical protein GGI18_001099 [Coemansia linderi]|uniref:Uncharacterized protein n=1 Tax=Coemansia linderi TaxID=2663919 RepID=A0ACC1KKM6_9FUNG|nr:hypothetical protein GGI18_001099 [Coemansia linderi]
MSCKFCHWLVEMGIMLTMPSLLKQETGSMLVKLHILQHMHLDTMGVVYLMKHKQDCIPVLAVVKCQAVADKVDDHLAVLVCLVFVQYGNSGIAEGKDVANHLYKHCVRIVSAQNTPDLSSAEGKHSLVVTSSWCTSLAVCQSHIL